MQKVIIMVGTSRASGRKFLRGIERYIRANAKWEVCIQPPHYLPSSKLGARSWFEFHEANGLIARDSQHTAAILGLKIPKIINDTESENPDTSTIYTNSEKTGLIAAEHFISLGFQNFAFCGFERLAWSDKRLQAYSGHLQKHGFSKTYSYQVKSKRIQKTETERRNISRWLQSLPKPVCVFACNDDRGIQVLEACKTAGLSVPEEVAVLGVDNDELFCDLSSPPLSSIELNFERGGYETARLLDKMMRSGKGSNNIVIEPVDIISRQSTNIVAIDDSQTAKAIIFIRENYHRPIQVKDVVAATVLSRRDLELKFRKILRRSIKDEINRLRAESIKRKLINSTDTIQNIARSLEYTDPEHFSRLFKQLTGHSPTQYRRLNSPFV